MTVFYAGATGLLILFVLFLVIPFWRATRTEKQKESAVSNPEIVRQRLNELQQEKTESLLTAEDYDEAVIEAKLNLADELDSASGITSTENKRMRLVVYVAMFLVILVTTAWVYINNNQLSQVESWLQAQQKLPELGQRIVVQADEQISRQELAEFALALRTKLSRQQDDAVGWLLLGRVLSSFSDFEGAIDAFNKSLAIEPERPGALFSLAQALLVTAESENMHKAERILLRLRAISPEDDNVLGLLAVTLSRNNKTQQSIDVWQELQARLDENDPMQATIEQQLAQLRTGSEAQRGAMEQAETKILVSVSIAPILRGKVPADGQLFVFVQDAESDNRMPAAVVKLPVDSLNASGSISVTLADADAMLPNYQLSSLTLGRVIARISSDDMVTAEAGDLQGQSTVSIVVGNTIEQAILIDKEL